MPITAGTQSVFYILNAAEPANGSLASNSLPAPARSLSDLVPMQLLQRTDGPAWRQPGAVDHEHVVDLRNGPLNLPMAGEALLWCRLFELGQFGQKHHIVRFEPLFDTSASHRLMEEIVLFECQGREDGERMAQLAAEGGHLCVSQRARPTMPCNAIVATWRSGSTVSVCVCVLAVHLSSGRRCESCSCARNSKSNQHECMHGGSARSHGLRGHNRNTTKSLLGDKLRARGGSETATASFKRRHRHPAYFGTNYIFPVAI